MFSIDNVKTLTGLPDEQVRLLAGTFLTEVRESRARLECSYAEKDWNDIRKLAHTLKPAYTLMGVAEVLDCIDYFLAISPVDPNEDVLGRYVQRFVSHSNHLESSILSALETETATTVHGTMALAL